MYAPFLFISLFAALAGWFQPAADSAPSLLLVDPDHRPRITITWTDAEGQLRSFEGERQWGGDADRTPLGANIAAYAAAGGTRLTTGAGHPRGAVIRFGFYKIDPGASFFEHIAADSTVRVEVREVRFNQPAYPVSRTILQHLKFAREALVSCRIPSDAWSLYNTADPHETLNGRARPSYDTRPGALSTEHAKAAATLQDDGSITLHADIPYALFKHIRDPWKRAIPGTFLEPIHFHLEIEVLPDGVPDIPPSADD